VVGRQSVASNTPVKPARSSRLRLRGREAVVARVASRLPAYEAEISPVWEAIPGQRALFASRRDTVLRRALALADGCAALVALLLAVIVTDGRISVEPTIVLLAPFVIIAAKAIGLYDRDQHVLRKTTIDEIPQIFYLSVLCALTVWLVEAVLLDGNLGRPGVFMLLGSTFALIFAGRLVIRGVVTAIAPPERCLVIGNAEDAERIASKLGDAGVKTIVTGRVPLGGREGLMRGGAGCADPELLRREIREQLVHRVIIAPDGHDQDEVLHVIRMIKALGVKVTVLPRLLEVVGSSSTYEDVDGMTLLGVRQFGATKSSEALKRSMDILGAGLTVLVLAPLLALLAAAVKLDSRGPVLFRQRRIGRHGEVFPMLKFRSMIPDAEAQKQELRGRNEVQGGLFKIADDPRITRMGRFLRRTSLDELPQLFNVLGGSMSLVGPRPLVQDEDALIEGWQRRRLAVKPGMTGMWQIFGSSRIPMHEMVKIDYLYGANWSIWLDLKILLRTVPYVLRRRGL
jgi:exopolysaccharide biosynthesis polyprenyl glycosylphosphotransferase